MAKVRPKKFLGQHFLHDPAIARRIVSALPGERPISVLEIGPGMGILTQFLLQEEGITLKVIDIDRESIAFLRESFPDMGERILEGDFLKLNFKDVFDRPLYLIGNLPYNLSSQIFFKVLENRERVQAMVCMIQKEVAERIVSGPGRKSYGILSVFLQAFYSLKLLFQVSPGAFNPPPKVMSAVILLERNDRKQLNCNEDLFFKVVKQGFNNRRKTLRNALKNLNLASEIIADPILNSRAEQLSVEEFERLALRIENSGAKEL